MKSLALLALFPMAAFANPALHAGENAIRSLTGCYLVDYSYAETESLKDGYEKDGRVYDVNRDKSVKEWIYTIEQGPGKIRLQHILFATDLEGNVMEGSHLRHQAEDWEFNAPFLYEFTKPLNWKVQALPASGLWTRRITNLDDGLRYQCAAAWSTANAFPEWSCSNYAPIPGRETRDMGRKDYNTLDRTTRIVAYGNSWLERQDNVKTIDQNGTRTPLAREVGKNWYVRLPDSDCASAQEFVATHSSFWNLLREIWAEILNGGSDFIETAPVPGQPNRYMKIMNLESVDVTDPENRASVKHTIRQIIKEHRAN